MYDEITAGMRRQVTLIESALERPLTDDDDVRELRSGVFYVNPEEIVRIDKHGSERVSFFLLEPELQHDIVLNYMKE